MELDFVRPDGTTLRAHLKQGDIQKKHRNPKGFKPNPMLESKLIPIAVSTAYDAFMSIVRTTLGEPIKFSELKAWCDLTGYDLSGAELSAIQTFDTAVLNRRYELTKHFRDMSAQ